MEFSLFFVLFIAYFTSYINAEVDTPVTLPLIDANLAERNQFKYQVSLQLKGAHHCGGGIIADQFILTAAHCVVYENGDFLRKKITVLAGVLDTKNDKGVEAEVEAIYMPKTFHYGDEDDIAVLKLKNGLGLDKNDNLMRLMRPNKIRWNYPTYAGTTGIVTGYGLTKVLRLQMNGDGELRPKGPSDSRLRFAEADIVSNTECNYLYGGNGITRNHICARVRPSSSNADRGICSGDSGGPLVVDSHTVVGVVSASSVNCNERLKPGKYTRVSSFNQFINDVINGIRTSDMRVATWDDSWKWVPFTRAKYVEN